MSPVAAARVLELSRRKRRAEATFPITPRPQAALAEKAPYSWLAQWS